MCNSILCLVLIFLHLAIAADSQPKANTAAEEKKLGGSNPGRTVIKLNLSNPGKPKSSVPELPTKSSDELREKQMEKQMTESFRNRKGTVPVDNSDDSGDKNDELFSGSQYS